MALSQAEAGSSAIPKETSLGISKPSAAAEEGSAGRLSKEVLLEVHNPSSVVPGYISQQRPESSPLTWPQSFNPPLEPPKVPQEGHPVMRVELADGIFTDKELLKLRKLWNWSLIGKFLGVNIMMRFQSRVRRLSGRWQQGFN